VARQESRFVPLEPAHLNQQQAPEVSDAGELGDAFTMLGDDYQAVLRLYYWEEWSVGQIASLLSLPITTIRRSCAISASDVTCRACGCWSSDKRATRKGRPFLLSPAVRRAIMLEENFYG